MPHANASPASPPPQQADAMVVRIADLPRGENAEFRDTAFFQTRDALPTPEEVRRRADDTRRERPVPVVFEEMGLLVKYGTFITIAEGQCLWYLNRFMKHVPTPEVYGWGEDDGRLLSLCSLSPGRGWRRRGPTCRMGSGMVFVGSCVAMSRRGDGLSTRQDPGTLVRCVHIELHRMLC